MDGIRREKLRITSVRVISLAYQLNPEEEWPDGDDNVIIYKTESVIVEGLCGPRARGVWAGVDTAMWDIVGRSQAARPCRQAERRDCTL